MFVPKEGCMCANFIPFRACHRRNAPAEYVEVHLEGLGPVWARIEEPRDRASLQSGESVIAILGWGEAPLARLCDLSPEDRQKLTAAAENVEVAACKVMVRAAGS